MLRDVVLMSMLCIACAGDLFDHRQSDEQLSDDAQQSMQTSAIVFDAVPLTATWQRFFGIDTEIFTSQQRKDLGTISYVGETPMLLNGIAKNQVDQAYLRTLRAVLLDQCQTLADKEMIALQNAKEGDVFTQHVLIKRYGMPSAAEVSAIMSRMFGYQSAKHRGSK